MKKSQNAKLALRRLTISDLRRSAGGVYRPTYVWQDEGSYNDGCSNSCNSCEDCGWWFTGDTTCL